MGMHVKMIWVHMENYDQSGAFAKAVLEIYDALETLAADALKGDKKSVEICRQGGLDSKHSLIDMQDWTLHFHGVKLQHCPGAERREFVFEFALALGRD